MLRRAPTTITLTSADIELYEARRQRKLWEQQQQQQQQQANSSQSTENSENIQEKDFKVVPQTQKSKTDRIMGTGGQGN